MTHHSAQSRPIWKKAPPGLQRPSCTDSSISGVLYWPNPSISHLGPHLSGLPVLISTDHPIIKNRFTFLKQWLANMYVNLCWDYRSMNCWFRILRHDFRDFWGPRCIARMFILGMSNKCLMSKKQCLRGEDDGLLYGIVWRRQPLPEGSLSMEYAWINRLFMNG